MWIISRLLEKRRIRIAEQNQKCDDLIARITAACSVANGYISDKSSFAEVGLADKWKADYTSVYNEINSRGITSFRKCSGYDSLKTLVNAFDLKWRTLKQMISRHNEEVAENRLNEAYALIGNVEGQKLDKQQMLAIIKETDNHLIIAGAGTGKTTTVVGKIKYLLKSGKCEPQDILVLSFTNASAAEMSERIAKETGCIIAASTFHKLGINIITKAEGVKPKVSQISLQAFIREKLKTLLNDTRYMRALSSYLLYNRVQAKSEFDFSTEREYNEYLKLNPPVTIRNESVKSYGEMDIANFLLQNGVNYIYEAEYKIDTRTSEYSQYYPDFFLPDYGIYIEYFGINKSGNVPDWFSGRNGMSATQSYRDSMEWKRNLHKENGTVMIECYAYEKFEGNLLENLEKKLQANGVTLTPKTPQELWSMVSQEGNTVVDGIIELFGTVINLIKSNNYTLQQFREIASRAKNSAQSLRFIDLVEPLFNLYEQELKKTGEIDFNDMINLATEYVRTGKVVSPFTHVIVDEYQDISKARFSLLAALRASKHYELFCVGDDWQSIYRFAGSDISYILNFEKYWGPTTISKIETTYRFTQSLIDISGAFITRNPHQIKKRIRGMSKDMRFSLGEISGYNEKYAVEFMAAKIDDLPKNSSVFFIGRYSFDVDMMKNSGLFDCRYNNVTGFVDVKCSKRPDLNMCYLTAHRSKGLQADYVFVINNKNSRMGFPSKIQDDPILDLLLETAEDYPFAEERRLYYVALTRAKTKAYFLVIKNNASVFAQELQDEYASELRKEQFECPLCGGRLERKTGPYGEFFGCSNYGITGCRYKRKIKPKANEKTGRT
ncbi:MAG: UvrD-helicase domain-containing protein [Clostridia bacterium]|nr:UvrD-helicase domain-containing protein [Clostridia bacterium]